MDLGRFERSKVQFWLWITVPLLLLLLALLLHLAALCGLPAGSRPAVTQAPPPLQVSVSFSGAPAPQATGPAGAS